MRERRERTGRGCGDKMIRSEFWGYPKLPGILLEIITGKGRPSITNIRTDELFVCSLYLLGVYIK